MRRGAMRDGNARGRGRGWQPDTDSDDDEMPDDFYDEVSTFRTGNVEKTPPEARDTWEAVKNSCQARII